MHGYEFSLHRNGSNQVQKERLACTVFANHYSKCRSAFDEAIDVFDQCIELAHPADLNQVLTDARNNASTQ
ncbi:hypothetical protein D3C78_1886490 [compost metagenome]